MKSLPIILSILTVCTAEVYGQAARPVSPTPPTQLPQTRPIQPGTPAGVPPAGTTTPGQPTPFVPNGQIATNNSALGNPGPLTPAPNTPANPGALTPPPNQNGVPPVGTAYPARNPGNTPAINNNNLGGGVNGFTNMSPGINPNRGFTTNPVNGFNPNPVNGLNPNPVPPATR